MQPGDGHWPTPGRHRVVAPSTTLSRGSLMLISLLFPSQPIYMVGHTALRAWQRITQSLHLPYMVGRGLLFQVWFHPMTQSTLNPQWAIKPGDSSVVIGYQVDEFTHTWSEEQFVACSHIYPGFPGKVSSLNHFPLEPGCEDYSFLNKAMAGFE